MKTVSTFLITLLLFGSLFIVVADKAEAQQAPLCCQNTPNSCNDNNGGTTPIKCISEDAIVFDAFCNEATGRCELEPRDVPTISEWGLIAMAGILGLIGLMVIRRKKVSA